MQAYAILFLIFSSYLLFENVLNHHRTQVLVKCYATPTQEMFYLFGLAQKKDTRKCLLCPPRGSKIE